MTTYEVENMKKVKLKLLLGIFIAGSINTGIAMESKSARDNKELVQQENKEQEDRVYFNSSLLEIIPAMKTFGYEAELVSVDAEVTDDDGEPIIKVLKMEYTWQPFPSIRVCHLTIIYGSGLDVQTTKARLFIQKPAYPNQIQKKH